MRWQSIVSSPPPLKIHSIASLAAIYFHHINQCPIPIFPPSSPDLKRAVKSHVPMLSQVVSGQLSKTPLPPTDVTPPPTKIHHKCAAAQTGGQDRNVSPIKSTLPIDVQKLDPEQVYSIKEKLNKWHRNKKLACPSCKCPIGNIINNNVAFKICETGEHILEMFHTRCEERSPRKLYICLECGARSVHGAKRLYSRHCKCKQEHVKDSSSNNSYKPPSYGPPSCESDFQGVRNDKLGTPEDDSLVKYPFSDSGFDQVDSSCASHIVQKLLSSKEYDWPMSSVEIFFREHD